MYVFEFDGTSWNETAKIIAPDGVADDQFGERVDVSGDEIIVGARYDDDRGSRSGSAYIFERGASGWDFAIKLTAFDGSSSEYFGQDVAIHNGRAVVGAWGQVDFQGFFNAGAAYTYSRDGGVGSTWTIDHKLVASERLGGDFYGYSVDVSDDFGIIGADGSDDFWWGPDSGAAYVIEMNCAVQCPADLTGDGDARFLRCIRVFGCLWGWRSLGRLHQRRRSGLLRCQRVPRAHCSGMSITRI